MRHSHTLGRIEHGKFAGQAGADPERVVAAMKLGGYEVVNLKLEPGDVAFMHSNTLHASAPNESNLWRRNMIVAYNSKENSPLPDSPAGQPPYNAIKVVPDEEILRSGVRKLDGVKNNFLGQ
jgi:ectoine hydroxylase-related dioxygenase (phytanoyl-CoA dioxygenase family)